MIPMTNSELILRLVEMLLQQKEEIMKAKEEKEWRLVVQYIAETR